MVRRLLEGRAEVPMAPGMRSHDDGETLDSLLHALTREEERRLLRELDLPDEDEPALDHRDEAWLQVSSERVAWPPAIRPA